jgi:hypothetical protein
MDTDDLVEVWRRIIAGPGKSWVLFSHGTIVVLTEPGEDLAAQATELLREFGPVHVGSPAGDFGTSGLADDPGWVVYGQHSDVLTYVAPDEVDAEPDTLEIGLVGRGKRDQDGHELTVVHVEDRREERS